MFVVFMEIMVPILLIFLTGYIGQKVLKISIQPVSTMVLYLMLPPLVFRIFYDNPVDFSYIYILIYSLLLFFAILIIVKLISYLFKYDTYHESALLLSTAFMNTGNLGAPFILFAFGEEAFQIALAVSVLQVILMNTLGVYVAAVGRYGLRQAFISILKMPVLYGLFAALVWQFFELPVIPENIYFSLDMVAEGAIPGVMIILGMQLAEIKMEELEWLNISLALLLRLLISPLIAVAIVYFLPVTDMMGKVFIIQAAMPTAAIITMYSLYYECRPGFVSSVTFLSTLVSILTLSILLTVLSPLV